MLIIHKLLLNVRPEKASQNLMQSLEVLRRETDEKYGKTFFSAQSLENVIGSADTVAEATAVDLAKAFSHYVLDFIDYKAFMSSQSVCGYRFGRVYLDLYFIISLHTQAA
jgi:hypothetical protein